MAQLHEIQNLDYNPILKQLLIEYIYGKYEEDAIIDDLHLWQEFRYMVDNNKLIELFQFECMSNKINDEQHTG